MTKLRESVEDRWVFNTRTIVTRKPAEDVVERFKDILRPDLHWGGQITEVRWTEDTLVIETEEVSEELSLWDFPKEVLIPIGDVLKEDPDSLNLDMAATILAAIEDRNEEEDEEFNNNPPC